MSLNLPADAEPFGEDWSEPGCYAVLYDKPDNAIEKMDDAFDTRPPWADAYESAAKVLYVGEASDVMYRLEDHAQRHVRKNALAKIGCEPVSIEAIKYHDTKEKAEAEEYNTAVRLSEQVADNVLVLCNGEQI